MASEVKIILSAVDNASAVLNKATGSLGNVGKSIGDTAKQFAAMAVAGGLAYKAVDGVVDFFKSSVSDTLDYAKAVRDVARYTGTSYEESSKFLQIADDLQIETTALKMGFRNLNNEGIQPNIENIKELAIEYQSLKDPVDKAQFAMKMFGARSGMEMAKMLELTTDQIDEMALSAENLGLVLDEQAIQSTEAYRLSVDQLDDSWKGLKTTVGTGIIPLLTQVSDSISENISDYQFLNRAIDLNTLSSDEMRIMMESSMTAADIYSEALLRLSGGLGDTRRESILAMEAIQASAGDYGEITEEVDKLGEAMQKYSNALIFNKAAQNMDADAAIQLGIQLGVIDTRTLVLNQALPKLTAQFDANANGMIDAGAEAAAYVAQLMGIANAIVEIPAQKTVTIDIIYNVHGRPVGFGTDDEYGDRGGVPYKQYGGPVSANRPYIVGEAGPEMFVPNSPGRIVPNNQLGGSMGNIVIHNHSAGAAALSWAMVKSHQKRRLQRGMGG